MTYCVGLYLRNGLVFMSDTRTNAGVDNVSVFRKVHRWHVPGERALVLLSAGNLATTQAVISILEERAKAPSDRAPSLLEAPSMFQAARLIGDTLREVISSYTGEGQTGESAFGATIILGGQIGGGEHRLFLIYPEGNFIEASDDNPFFQIGETKYGRPILVRALDRDMSFEDAVRLLLVSFDSTIKANLSVGLPLDLLVYEKDSYTLREPTRIQADDPYYTLISENWGQSLKDALVQLPPFTFEGGTA